MNTPQKPSFLFIGAGRVGSNWFVEVLREHPDVFIPLNRGTFFFSHHYHMGFDWYERFFTGARRRAVGEVCEDYLSSPEALHRIKEYCPAMRLVCCLRNPYERAISEWRFFGRNGRGRATLVAQAEFPAIMERGCYATQLQTARSLFDHDRIMIFFFEEIASNPQSVVRRLYDFIGVDPHFVPSSLHRRINGNGRPRLKSLARLVHDIHIRSWGASRIVSNAFGQLKRIRPLRRLVQKLLYEEQFHTDNWRDLLAEFPQDTVARYEDEITALEQMLERDLSDWRAARREG